MDWLAGERLLDCGVRALVMGVVNVTPDSFYSGGRHPDPGAAAAHALRLVDEGADLVDVGGESSRPPVYGQTRDVPAAEEWARVVPVVAAVRRQSEVAISVDTAKAAVAERALAAGADVVNDISALTADPRMLDVVAAQRAGVVLMHMRGTPRTMQLDTDYADLPGEVTDYLQRRLAACEAAGIARRRLVVDPGLGFGKSVAGNLELLASLPRLASLGRPLLLGASRKSFLWKPLGLTPETALEPSLAAAVVAVLRGARILRVHDVGPTVRALRLVDAVLQVERGLAAVPSGRT